MEERFENINEECRALAVIENKTPKKKKRHIHIAIWVVLMNMFILSAVFASGYFFGSDGKLLGTVTAQPNIDKIIEN